MKLSGKIAASMGLLTLLIAGMGVYLIMQLSNVNGMVTFVSNNRIPIVQALGEVNNAASEYRLYEVSHIHSTSQEEMKRYEKLMEGSAQGITNGIKKIDALMMPAARPIFNEYLQARDKYREQAKKTMQLSIDRKDQEAVDLLMGDSLTYYRSMSMAIEKLGNIVSENTVKVNRDANALYEQARLTGIALVGAAVLVALSLTLLLVRNTIRQLGKDPGDLNVLAQRVVDGDYDINDGSPQIGVYGSIVEMVAALKTNIDNARVESENAKEQSHKAQEAMQQTEAASNQAQAKTQAMLSAAERLDQVAGVVSSATTELSAQIEQADRGAAEAAQRLAEAATAMNEMNATVQEVAKNASSASQASVLTRDKAEDGSRIVEKSLHSIELVHQVSVELKEDMTRLNDHAQAITQIMNVISDIADQTNLLALNAAIEAARAGEAGRGFAVVADEVRKLAEKTMASTHDVGSAIKAIQESTTKSMSSVDNAVQQIEKATGYANESGAALQEIVATVESTADQVSAIATASEEQSAASEEINHSLVQVNDMSRQTADAMAESAKAVVDLSAQAQELASLISDMKQG